jgi:hypothetical protein
MNRWSRHCGTSAGLIQLIVGVALFALAPLTRAQCPQICDDNNSTAIGFDALFENTTGFDNTANGYQALFSNTTGFGNMANGYQALMGNTHGDYNTASGNNALFSNTGSNNTATGAFALAANTTGSANTANGVNALSANTTGGNNIALGFEAGARLTTGINNIDIGSPGLAGEANTIRIGKQITQRTTFIAGISGATVPTGVAVIIDTDGHLGTTTSSARFKEAIKPMDKASEVILGLKPVTFRYKHELDPEGIPQFGLVAEQVEKVNPDLVARDRARKTLQRALRSGERDVAQRVPQRTQGICRTKERNRSAQGDRATAGG